MSTATAQPTPASAAPDFTEGKLCRFLVGALPIYVDGPFDIAPRLNVEKLRVATGKSHEAVYKWLRRSKLTPENASLLLKLANAADNVAVLNKLDRKPPTLADFHEFVFDA